MRNSNNLVRLFVFFVIGAIVLNFWPFLIVGAVLFGLFTHSKMEQGKDAARKYKNRNFKSGRTHSDAEVDLVNAYLKSYFSKGKKNLQMRNGIMLVVRGIRYRSLDDLDVYKDHVRIGSLLDYRMKYGASYNRVFDDLLDLANNRYKDVVDVEIVEKKTVEQEEVVEKVNINDQYIMKINELNIEIPDKDISNMLYETTALLRQLDLYQTKFKKDMSSYSKLYEYYLPMIVKILEQYVVLQVAKHDPNYQKTVQNVNDTIGSLNGAIRDLIADTTDQDFMNLSADITTLDTLLKKDGFGSGIQVKKMEDLQ